MKHIKTALFSAAVCALASFLTITAPVLAADYNEYSRPYQTTLDSKQIQDQITSFTIENSGLSQQSGLSTMVVVKGRLNNGIEYTTSFSSNSSKVFPFQIPTNLDVSTCSFIAGVQMGNGTFIPAAMIYGPKPGSLKICAQYSVSQATITISNGNTVLTKRSCKIDAASAAQAKKKDPDLSS